jgi:hypothetical protein
MPTVRITGERWRVELKSTREYGYCCHDERLITIGNQRTLTRAEIAATAIHEAIHAACPWMDEEHVEATESAVMQVLRAVGETFGEEA